MNDKLIVENLPGHIEDNDLKELFAPFGLVLSVKVVEDLATGMGRGFAFVRMQEPSQAQKAAEALNGRKVEDREIQVHTVASKFKYRF
jgi:RNA recognition motif-containing protein